MKSLKLSLVVGVVAFLLSVGAGVAPAAISYTGSLASNTGGLTGTGSWVNTAGDPTTMTWDVSQNSNGTYHYSYTLTPGGSGGISHMIIQTSGSFKGTDITNSSCDYSLGTWSPSQGNSNPGMPAAEYGLEFQSGTVSFNSDRAPVWGDFYSKDGNAGGDGTNAVWNTGFTNPPFNPANPPANGSVGDEILVPDSVSVPEPATITLLGLGLGGLLARRRRGK